MQALHVGTLVQVRGDLLPVLGSELSHQFRQIQVLFRIPVPFGILRLLSTTIILIRLKCTIAGLRHRHIGLRLLILLEHFLRVVIALRLRVPLMLTGPCNPISSPLTLPRGRPWAPLAIIGLIDGRKPHGPILQI